MPVIVPVAFAEVTFGVLIVAFGDEVGTVGVIGVIDGLPGVTDGLWHIGELQLFIVPSGLTFKSNIS